MKRAELEAAASKFLPRDEVKIKTKKELKKDIQHHLEKSRHEAEGRHESKYESRPPAKQVPSDTMSVIKALGIFFEDDTSDLARLVSNILDLEARLKRAQQGKQLFTVKEHHIITTSLYDKLRHQLNEYYMERNKLIEHLLTSQVLDATTVTFFEHQQQVLFQCLNHLTQNKVGK